jgi:hypothetical protein
MVMAGASTWIDGFVVAASPPPYSSATSLNPLSFTE